MNMNRLIIALIMGVCSLLSQPVQAFDECSDSFTDGLQSHDPGGSINFDEDAILFGSPDNILDTPRVNIDEEDSCDSGDCRASGTPAPAIDPGAYETQSGGSNLNIPNSGSGSIGGSSIANYADITVGQSATLNTNAAVSNYWINSLTVDTNTSEINLTPGTYWIDSLHLGNDARINVIGAGTVLIISRNEMFFGRRARLNISGAADEHLILYSYSDITIRSSARVKAVIYAQDDVTVGDNARVEGVISAARIFLGEEAEITYNASMVTEVEFGQLCPPDSIDHIEIIHDGSGLTCNPETLTVKACTNTSCSIVATADTTVVLSATGQPSFFTPSSILIPANSAAGVTVSMTHTTAEVTSLSATSVPAASTVTQCNGSPSDCDMEFFDSGFIFDVPTQTSCETSASVVIRAVRKDNVSQQCVPGFSNKAATLKFWTNYIAPATGAGNQTTLNYSSNSYLLATSKGTDVPVNFDVNGEIAITINYPDAGNQSLHASFDGTTGVDAGLIMSGADNFVTVPAKLNVFSNDANSACASNDANCSVFKAAGSSFNLSVAAACADNSITPNFEMDNIPLSINTVAPASGNPVSLGVNTASIVNADNGSHTVANETVSEVGVFTISASPVAGAYHGETVPQGTSVSLGRFIPDRFLITDNAPAFRDGDSSWSCNFSYQQQPFEFATGLNPILTITAVNQLGIPTLNYGGSFWKLSTNAADRVYVNQAAGISALLSADLSSSTVTLSATSDFDGVGLLTLSGDVFQYQKAAATPNANDAPFAADVILNIPIDSLKDTDNVCLDAANDGICESYNSGNITGTNVRWGRWFMENAIASELESVTMTAVAQQFDGNVFQLNTEDICSASHASWTAPSLSDYTQNLTAGETLLSQSAMILGVLPLTLTAPGEGNNGSTLVTLPTPAWMFYDYDGNGAADAASATATFGIFKGKSPIIYWRQKYGN